MMSSRVSALCIASQSVYFVLLIANLGLFTSTWANAETVKHSPKVTTKQVTTKQVSTKAYSPVVEQLKTMIEVNPLYQKKLHNMLQHVPATSPWYNKHPDDVYACFNDLLTTPILPGLPRTTPFFFHDFFSSGAYAV